LTASEGLKANTISMAATS